ncbi:MAG: hypothetical protein CMJ37_00135 [Phycisphaerae bacterium]|nr:hypothetical protein [Phycisphaerae bacterium]
MNTNPPRRSIVIANAGCGKTWTLSTRFARWCLDRLAREGKASPERILALTFTRKAAGEILEAVVLRFNEALDGDKAVMAALGYPSEQALRSVMLEFAQAIPRLKLNTIDGFFNQLVRVFSNELGLPENWRIADESEIRAARLQALERVIDAQGVTDCFALVKDGMPRSTVLHHLETELLGAKGDMATSVLGVYRRTLLGRGYFAWLAGSEHDPCSHQLRTDSDLFKLTSRLADLDLPLKKDGEENQYFEAKRDLIVQWVRTEDWEAVLEDTFVQRASPHAMDSKYRGTIIPASWSEVIMEVVHHAMAHVAHEGKHRVFRVANFLAELDDACWEAQAEQSAYSFGDLASRLAVHGKMDEWSWEWLQHRLDSKIDDLALDEFQDTSVDQMRVLDRLMQEVNGSDDDRRFLLVGDPKQSIYGWRGGTPELIEKVRLKYHGFLDDDAPLMKSFRTCPLLMEAVNQVFADLTTHADEVDPDSGMTQRAEQIEGVDWPGDLEASVLSRASSIWMEGWNQHESAKEEYPGLLTWTVAEHDKNWQAANAHSVAEVVARRRRLRPSATIAVLARTNKELAEVFLACKEAGLDSVSMEGKSALLDSLLVQQVLALFRLADHSTDELAHYLATRWIFPSVAARSIPGLQLDPVESIPTKNRSAARRQIALHVRRQLVARGTSGLIADLYQAVVESNESIDFRELDRLQELVSVSRLYEDSTWPRPLAFVEAIEGHRQGNQKSGGVRLMTIHGSKGLGFDEVVLTGVKKSLGLLASNEMDRFMAYESDPTEGTQIVLPGPNAKIRSWFPSLQAVASETRVRKSIDPISMAYVALTRAKTAVHLVAQPYVQKSDGKKNASIQRSFAWLFAKSYPDLANAWKTAGTDAPGLLWALEDHGEVERDESGKVHLESNEEFMAFDQAQRSEQTDPADPIEPPTLTRQQRRGLARGRSASTTHESKDWSALLETRKTEILDRGTVLHERFRQVEWADDADPTIEQLRQARRTVERDLGRTISDTTWAEANATFSGAINLTQIQDTFLPTAHGAGKEDLDVRNEFPVLTRDGQGRVVRGRLDRLVLRREGNDVVEAWVMDHKSGATKLDDSAFQTRIDHYTPQLEAYAKVVQERWGLPQAKVHCVLIFFERGEVIQVPRSAESSQ